MHPILIDYIGFLLQAVTVVVSVGVVAALIASAFRGRRMPPIGRLTVRKLNDRFKKMSAAVNDAALPPAAAKVAAKNRAKERKKRDKEKAKSVEKSGTSGRKRVFVLDFRGDVRAKGVKSMREEITAVIGAAKAGDEVVVKVESGGGAVSAYGLAASQLERIRTAGLKLTTVVDKVAASGGYMMAVVGDRIVAAPFAVVGSIGVIAGVPNVRRLLQQHGVDYEQITAGKFKRTLTVMGENTEEGRAKMQAEMEDIHTVFKELITSHRPDVNLDKIATGEWWLAKRGIELGLVDELGTSDDVLLAAAKDADVFEVKWSAPRSLSDRMGGAVEAVIRRAAVAWMDVGAVDPRF